MREALRGFDLTADGTGLTPDVETAEEAAYSRFSTLTVRFLDTDTATAALLALAERCTLGRLLHGLALGYEVGARAGRERRPCRDRPSVLHAGARECRRRSPRP